MVMKIEQDHGRFRQIVRGKIKENLRRYVTQSELLVPKGRGSVTVPIPQISLPRFRFSAKRQGGVGQGPGDPGTPVGPGDEQGQGEPSAAGNQQGEHVLEVDVTLEEMAAILGEALELPNIKPRGRKNLKSSHDRYTGISKVGPESLRHFKRTFKRALRREIMAGGYDGERPIIVPSAEDRRFRAPRVVESPQNNAVILYLMDVSGSMGDEQKEIVRVESFWIDTWLRSQYKGLETRFVIHDVVAREVDRDTFFHVRESGGTAISSAYKLTAELLESEFPPDQWNVYVFHFSDGDNWSVDDTKECLSLLDGRLLPRVNLFAYGQVSSPYGSGQFLKDLRQGLKADNLVTSQIESRDGIYDSIKTFLGRGM
jgi:uncharacterized sporulation protein YeaH/YhbH (DUF444 family)